MNHDLERRYFVEKTMDFAEAIKDEIHDLHLADDNRVLFRFHGRPFEVLAWINEESDMICVTTRTVELPISQYEKAVELLQASLEICWEYCVAVSKVEARYDLSMGLFLGGFTLDAFEAAINNLMNCAAAIEEKHQAQQPESSEAKTKEE